MDDVINTTKFERSNSVVRTLLHQTSGASDDEYETCLGEIISPALHAVEEHCDKIQASIAPLIAQDESLCDTFKHLREGFSGMLEQLQSKDPSQQMKFSESLRTDMKGLHMETASFIAMLGGYASGSASDGGGLTGVNLIIKELQALYRFVVIVSNTLDMRFFSPTSTDAQIQAHYQELFDTHISGGTVGCQWETLSVEEQAVRVRISKDYNALNMFSDRKLLNELFDVSVNFTIHYYAKNRSRFWTAKQALDKILKPDSGCAGTPEISKWIETLA